MTVVIIGTGLAGYQLARNFRKLDNEATITLFTEDDGNFYSKPLLSTAFTHKKTPEMLAMASHEKMAEELNATIHTHTSVTSIDAQKKIVHHPGGEVVYDKLIFACGARATDCNIPGATPNNLYSVNSLQDYAMLRSALEHKKHILILGSGLVGCELANDLHHGGFDTTVVTLDRYPLARFTHETPGRAVEAALTEQGTTFYFEQTISEITSEGYAKLSDGNVIECDLIISAIGLTPNIMLAQEMGLQVQHGIDVNTFLETSQPNVYALGDCAQVNGEVLPYIMPLTLCARALAQTLSGNRTAVEYPAMPVIAKVSCCPIALVPALNVDNLDWQFEQNGNSVKALCYQGEQLVGFTLTGEYAGAGHMKERMALVKAIR